MPVPVIYRRNAPVPSIGYDFTDVAEGTGQVHFYGFAITNNAAAVSYHLTTQNFLSKPKYAESPETTNGTFEVKESDDFDLAEFNYSKVVEGTAYLTGSYGLTSATAGTTHSAYIIFTFYHYDGTTETSLGSAQTETITTVGTTGVIANFCLKAALTKKLFRRGDQLRITADLYAKRDAGAGGGGLVYLAHDPQNGLGAWAAWLAATYPTTLNFYVPFNINL